MNPLTSRILAGVTVAAAAAVLSGLPVLAVPGGLLLGFALPGFALTEVLFRARVLSAVERTVLTPALSLAVLVGSGLVVYVLQIPLDRTSWTVATAAVTLAALVAWTALDVRDRLAVRSRARTAAAAAKETERDGTERDETAPVPDADGPGSSREAGAETVKILPGTDAPTQVIPAVRDEDAPTRVIPAVRDGGAAPAGALPDAVRLAEEQAQLAQQRVQQAEQRAERRRQQRRVVREFLPLVAVVAVLAGAGWLSFHSSYDSYEVTVTSLSAAPPGPVGSTGDRVVEVTASGLVGADGPYSLTVTGDGGTRQPRRAIAVPAGGTWTATLTVPADERTTIGLYRASDSSPFRTVLIAAAR